MQRFYFISDADFIPDQGDIPYLSNIYFPFHCKIRLSFIVKKVAFVSVVRVRASVRPIYMLLLLDAVYLSQRECLSVYIYIFNSPYLIFLFLLTISPNSLFRFSFLFDFYLNNRLLSFQQNFNSLFVSLIFSY